MGEEVAYNISFKEKAIKIAVAQLWVSILELPMGPEEIKDESTFIQLGASVLAMRFLMEAEMVFNKQFSMQLLAQCQTLSEFSKGISNYSMDEEGDILEVSSTSEEGVI